MGQLSAAFIPGDHTTACRNDGISINGPKGSVGIFPLSVFPEEDVAGFLTQSFGDRANDRELVEQVQNIIKRHTKVKAQPAVA